jgi:outer membrane protein assembly factor BamB
MHSLALMTCLLLGATPTGPWPGFRGHGDSLTAASDLPLKWSETENIAWKAELSGYGQSSPVVWGDRAFVTSSGGDEKEKLFVDAYDINSGKRLWQYELPGSQTVKVSNYVSRSAPTPVVDGEGVYAFYESGDLVALDHDGKLLWKRSLTGEFGKIQGNHGLGGSPAQTEKAVVLLIDHDGPSYLLAVDKMNGATLWKTDRDSRISWTSPLVIERNGQEQVIITSNGVVQGYAMNDGRKLWEIDGFKGNTVASVTPAGDLLVVGSSEKGQSCVLRLNEKEPLTKPEVVWRPDDTASSFASPLVLGGYAYFVAKGGVMNCLALADGAVQFTHRLPESCWASPLGAGDRVYFFTTGGTTLVLKAGAKLDELALNELPTTDKVYGVAAVKGALLIRTGTTLIKVQERSS